MSNKGRRNLIGVGRPPQDYARGRQRLAQQRVMANRQFIAPSRPVALPPGVCDLLDDFRWLQHAREIAERYVPRTFGRLHS